MLIEFERLREISNCLVASRVRKRRIGAILTTVNTNAVEIYTCWHFLTICKPSPYFSGYKLNLILSASQLFILLQLYCSPNLYQPDTVEP